jgi:hypothetical protein
LTSESETTKVFKTSRYSAEEQIWPKFSFQTKLESEPTLNSWKRSILTVNFTEFDSVQKLPVRAEDINLIKVSL